MTRQQSWRCELKGQKHQRLPNWKECAYGGGAKGTGREEITCREMCFAVLMCQSVQASAEFSWNPEGSARILS